MGPGSYTVTVFFLGGATLQVRCVSWKCMHLIVLNEMGRLNKKGEFLVELGGGFSNICLFVTPTWGRLQF